MYSSFCQGFDHIFVQVKTKTLDIPVKPNLGAESHDADFVPIVRSGAWTDIGFRSSMEDVYICADNFTSDYGLKNATDGPNAFYGVLFSFSLFSLYILMWDIRECYWLFFGANDVCGTHDFIRALSPHIHL